MVRLAQVIAGVLALVWSVLVGACAPSPTPTDGGELLRHADALGACRVQGAAAAADGGPEDGWTSYAACKKDGGL